MGAIRNRRRNNAGQTQAAAEPTVGSIVLEDHVDAARFRRLIDASIRLRAAGVSHEDIQRRARRDAITFNEAVDLLDREQGYA